MITSVGGGLTSQFLMTVGFSISHFSSIHWDRLCKGEAIIKSRIENVQNMSKKNEWNCKFVPANLIHCFFSPNRFNLFMNFLKIFFKLVGKKESNQWFPFYKIIISNHKIQISPFFPSFKETSCKKNIVPTYQKAIKQIYSPIQCRIDRF